MKSGRDRGGGRSQNLCDGHKLPPLVEIDLTGIVTEKPREVAGERLLRRLSTTSYGKVASRFLIDVPIGNTKNAKALQVNKL